MEVSKNNESKLYEIYRRKDLLLDELLSITQRVVSLLSEDNIENLNAELIASLINERGQVIWTLEQLELEAEPLRREADNGFILLYQKHMDRMAMVFEQVMESDRTQYPIMQKHIGVLRKQLQDARNAQKMEQAYQSNNPYEQQENEHPRFLDTFK